MKRTRKNMLRSSAVMLLVSALALTSATYAWFTTGNSGKVENFNLTAEAASGIQLSADAETWKSYISQEDLTNYGTNTVFPANNASVNPVSSTGNVLNGALTFYSLTYNANEDSDADPTTLAEVTTGKNGNSNYIQFDLYVKNASASDTTLYLDLSKATVEAKSDTDSTGIENASRVAFVEQGTIEIGSTNDYVENVKAKSLSTGTAWIWEPNSTTHRQDMYGTKTLQTFAINKPFTEKEGLQLTNGILADTYARSGYLLEQDTVNDDIGTANTTTITTIKANSITKFTVYIWFEGQDVDCTNLEAGGSMTVQLNFTNTTT